MGPLIGGALTEHVSWRWCKYLKVQLIKQMTDVE
jgi:hypothetical protein